VAGVASVVARRAADLVDDAIERDRTARARLSQATRHQLHRHAERLESRSRRITAQARQQLEAAATSVEVRAARIGPCAHRAVANQAERLVSWRRLLAAYDVDRQLERGYTLTLGEDGRIVRSVGALTIGSVLVTRFADGTAGSEVRRVDMTGNTTEHGTLGAVVGEEHE
jgi:exodeoxyribonuclease VII large subunit